MNGNTCCSSCACARARACYLDRWGVILPRSWKYFTGLIGCWKSSGHGQKRRIACKNHYNTNKKWSPNIIALIYITKRTGVAVYPPSSRGRSFISPHSPWFLEGLTRCLWDVPGDVVRTGADGGQGAALGPEGRSRSSVIHVVEPLTHLDVRWINVDHNSEVSNMHYSSAVPQRNICQSFLRVSACCCVATARLHNQCCQATPQVGRIF